MNIAQVLPLPKWQWPNKAALPADLGAAAAVVFLGVPQGMAYATIAELPPALGLYAAAAPAVIGSLMRSSHHVVTGPTNALSLLVGAAVLASTGVDPVAIAVTLALMVGVLQIAAGVLRLGAIVDFISSAVVLGYITGAGVLIGAGQLYNAIGTAGPRGRLHTTLIGWSETVADVQPLTVAVTVGTVAVIALMRWRKSKIPSAIAAIGLATVVTAVFGLDEMGLKVVRDIAPVAAGLPPLSLPQLDLVAQLMPVAVACTVLSLIESNAVARSIAARSGQRLDASVEFTGQGFANLAAGLFSGYPISGSLSRSALNERAGARTPWAGAITGLMMIGILLVAGPALNVVPLAALAGLLLVVAWDLVDVPRLKATWKASMADRLALVSTIIGTWVLPLDQAIYLGVGLSVVLFMRRARLVEIVELVPDEQGEPLEVPLGELPEGACPRIRFVQVTGSLFFASSGPLMTALAPLTDDERVETIVLRLRRATGLDATAALAIGELASRLRSQQRELILTGIDDDEQRVLQRSGAAKAVGPERIIRATDRFLGGLTRALEVASVDLCADCPLAAASGVGPGAGTGAPFNCPRPFGGSAPEPSTPHLRLATTGTA
jgi:SulP family sulfate permease